MISSTRTSSAKGREILKSREKFPDFNLMDYDKSLRENLFFYNIEIEDNKKKKDWAIEFWKSQGKSVDHLKKISEGFFVTVGSVAHMIHHRKIDLDEKHYTFMDKKYNELSKIAKTLYLEPVKNSSVDEEKRKQEIEQSIIKSHIAEFDAGIDDFFIGKTFDAKSYLIRNNVKAGVTKQIADHLKPILKEVKEAISGKDPQLVEGYSHLGVRKLKKFYDYIQSLIDSCEVATAIVKASRKPRAKKIKTPSELIKNVKFLVEDEITKMKSEHPTKIINASEVWLYNAKNRRLFRYVSLSGMTLSVKGTTIINVDVEKSGGKIIRKPEITLSNIQNMTSRSINKLFTEIRGTKSKATGRLNEDTLIVKCF